MTFAAILIIARSFVARHWKVLAGGLLAVVLVCVFLLMFCRSRPKPQIDAVTIQKINTANESERKKELQKVIEDNSAVISTVDNRTTIAETNVIERNRLIDERVKDADRKIAEAKAVGRDVTSEELECILVPDNCK